VAIRHPLLMIVSCNVPRTIEMFDPMKQSSSMVTPPHCGIIHFLPSLFPGPHLPRRTYIRTGFDNDAVSDAGAVSNSHVGFDARPFAYDALINDAVRSDTGRRMHLRQGMNDCRGCTPGEGGSGVNACAAI